MKVLGRLSAAHASTMSRGDFCSARRATVPTTCASSGRPSNLLASRRRALVTGGTMSIELISARMRSGGAIFSRIASEATNVPSVTK